MTVERKKDLGFKLAKLVEELQFVAKETNSSISLYAQGQDEYDGISVFVHYGDGAESRMVGVDTMDEIKEIFFIERDDTVRKENEDGKDNTEE